ncbi:MAG: BRCT domain-containing protein, partial [Planctomycetota bacterium]
NIGSNERVYRGLTFTVYDRGTSVPEDGMGKAEIEVFDVAKTYSAARITRSELRKPILQGDIVANLIWDSDKSNVFVIVGDFDLDGDGEIDYNAADKLKALIEKWGGSVDDTVSIDTNFLVLGKMPQVLEKPTLDELEVDPRAMEKYETSLQRLTQYNQFRAQAQALWIPVFKYERFLYFIGYKSQVARSGAF